MIEGYDFSFGRPGGAAVASSGRHFVVRYVPYPGDRGKGLTRAEIKDYRAHGLAICLVFESVRKRPLDGRAAGIADARTSRRAIANLRMPSDQVVYFAVDWDAQAAQQPKIDAYLDGAASVLGLDRVGIYGGLRVIRRCKRNHSARWFWQTYAWSNQKVAAGIHLYQYSNSHRLKGKAVDYCRAMKADYGQWPAEGDGTATTGVDDMDMSGFVVFSSPRKIFVPKGTLLFQTRDFSDVPVKIDPGREMLVAGQFGSGPYLVGYTPDHGTTPRKLPFRIVRNRDVDPPTSACPSDE